MAKQHLNCNLNLALQNSNEEPERPESPQMNFSDIILNADIVFSCDLNNHDKNNILMSNECEANISTISSEEINLSDCDSVVGVKRKHRTKKKY